MELRTLSYFLAVAREQNMTEAANVLHVTQPTLSRQIADLEDELGKKLFTRTSRSTVLTEDGMHLRQRAEKILALVNQTEDEMKNDTIDLAGCIRIGAGETHAMHILADLFAELHSRYPRLTVELFMGNADTVEEKLAHGLIDFALMIEPFNVEQYHFIRLPETMRVGIVTRDDSKWAQKSGITPDDLNAMPLLVSSRQSLTAMTTVNGRTARYPLKR
ncbi:LysR family transcriptional regulator [Mitsuokella jalaludinii]|uniref:LysR family transcriptional regulator n=1 Tax=Mitsuokella jalaludinii TaxID=187979 RepID=UPI0030771369